MSPQATSSTLFFASEERFDYHADMNIARVRSEVDSNRFDGWRRKIDIKFINGLFTDLIFPEKLWLCHLFSFNSCGAAISWLIVIKRSCFRGARRWNNVTGCLMKIVAKHERKASIQRTSHFAVTLLRNSPHYLVDFPWISLNAPPGVKGS